MPAGVPPPGLAGPTVAVNVTGSPKADGLPDDMSDVLAAILTDGLVHRRRGRAGVPVGVAVVDGGDRVVAGR